MSLDLFKKCISKSYADKEILEDFYIIINYKFFINIIIVKY